MLIMAAAYARAVGASTAAPFLSQWQLLWTQWAEYLMTQVPTPSTQLTTDDWAPDYSTSTGSVNLGIKAIIGLAAAGQIATILGDAANATTWSDAATRQRRAVDHPLDRRVGGQLSERRAGRHRHLVIALQRLLRDGDRRFTGA